MGLCKKISFKIASETILKHYKTSKICGINDFGKHMNVYVLCISKMMHVTKNDIASMNDNRASMVEVNENGPCVGRW